MNQLPTLIRREYWEHRNLWIVPTVVAALIVCAAVFVSVDLHSAGSGFALRASASTDPNLVRFAVLHWMLMIPQFILMSVIVFFYLPDCLYAERKDRSILFWKSLPVSDALTVISKLLVVLLVAPVLVFVLALASDLAATVILAVRFRNSALAGLFTSWDTLVWLRVQGLMLTGELLVSLWYAPVFAYLLVISAWAKRNVMIWVALPPLIAIVVESVAFRTHYVAAFLYYRLLSIWNPFGIGSGLGDVLDSGGMGHPPSLDAVLARVNALPVLLNVDLWLGLIAAAALVWAAIFIRRNQDDA